MHLSRLEELPPEIRDQIYGNIFPCGEILVPGVHYTCGPIAKPFPSLALLQVNRRIAIEAATVLFKQNRIQIRMPAVHVCSLEHSISEDGCNDTRFGKPAEDKHSCTEDGCRRGHQRRHLAQRLLQRYGHQIQHAQLTLDSFDMVKHFGTSWIDRVDDKIMVNDLYDDQSSCRYRHTRRNSYIGWRWEGHALRKIAATGLRSMTLDLGDLWWYIYYMYTKDTIKYRKESAVELMQDLFRDLQVRKIKFQKFIENDHADVVWLNPGIDLTKGSGWIDSLTVIGLPCHEDISLVRAGLKQEGHRPAHLRPMRPARLGA